ncbi:MAG: Sensor histidine kinase TmoS [Syntrophus sp. SKADARSKE-3]|nr:Sensor histidine kinase TmoS [Syntrophus sp. SKADARSKE-3]
MKILNADDNPSNLYLVESLLKSKGYEVTSVMNGLEALNHLEKEPFDLIITDILMPVMDGFQLCREVKKREEFRGIPVIIYTATYTEDKDREFALSLGASRFIVKPEEPDIFLAVVENVLQEHEDGKIHATLPQLADNAEYLLIHNKRLLQKLEKKVQRLNDLEKDLLAVSREKNREEIERIHAEAAMQLAEDKYRNIFENAVEGILIADLETRRFIDANPAICAMLGYSVEELTQLSVSDIHPIEALPDVILQFKALARREIKTAVEVPCKRKDGRVFFADINTSVMTLDGEKYNVGFFSDSTERKQAKEELLALTRRLNNIIEFHPRRHLRYRSGKECHRLEPCHRRDDGSK